MAMPVASLLGGPVFRNEFMRAARKMPWKILGHCYAVWLLLQFVAIITSSDPPIASFAPRACVNLSSRIDNQREEVRARKTQALDYLTLLLYQQLLLVLLLTPAVTAGVVGHDKERDTLGALLITRLSAWEIVAGKLFSRLALLGGAGLAALPPLVVAAVFSEVGVARLLIAMAQAAVLMFALGAACLLCSVWMRRSGDAILACYATILLLYLALQLIAGSLLLPGWLGPIETLSTLLTRSEQHARRIAFHLASWLGVGACCLILAASRLRRAYLSQLAWRPRRWLWAFRPPIGNDPIRWREQYVIGLTPFPWLRMIPGWLAMLGVLGFSCVLATTALDSIYWGHGFREALEERDFYLLLTILRAPPNEGSVAMEVSIMGGILLVIGGVVVGVRCLGSIAEEKRRKTWDELRLMPLSLDEILKGKVVGVLFATLPYLFMYILPMFAIAALNGWDGIAVAVAWLCLACFILPVAAFVGTDFSATAERSREQGETLRIQSVAVDAIVTSAWDPVPVESEGTDRPACGHPGIRRADR
jgi:ABC-type transport system involved in multi-copper enzyme maturation permease subunit